MSISIVLDKSTFQGLNYRNVIELHRYYLVNVTPLLVSEILGDLSKEEKEGRRPPKQDVVNLSKKMFPFNSYVNMNYKNMVEMSLLGTIPKTDNRPYLTATRSINTPKGKGLFFVETEEEKSIKRWKNGKFDSIDEIISKTWRLSTKNEEVIKEFKGKFEFLKDIKLDGFKGTNQEKLDYLFGLLQAKLEDEIGIDVLLKKIIDYFEIDAKIAGEIFYRLESNSFENINDFSPYAFFCYKVVAMFYVGLNNNLFGDRATNLLDLEYLYYAPFSKVFSSNDKFLISLFNVIRPDNVRFITLESLKGDLTKFEKINTEEKWSEHPPDKETETFEIWKENYDLELSEKLKPSEKDYKRAKKRFEEILEMAENGEEGSFEGEPDFVIKERYLSKSDPCPCGSGKTLEECHLKN